MPAGIVPLLLQRRIVADQRVVVAVGAMTFDDGVWKLNLPAESNPILEGGAFAVLVPTKAWSWVTGTVSMPQVLAQTIREKLENKPAMDSGGQRYKRATSAFIAVHRRPPLAEKAIPSGDVAVKDALVSGNWLQAASGVTGQFALPVSAPVSGKLQITGQRWDLGLTGSVDADVLPPATCCA